MDKRVHNSLQSNLDYPDSMGLHEIVRIIEDMNINEEQKLITLRKRHLIVWKTIWSTSSLSVVNTCTRVGKRHDLFLALAISDISSFSNRKVIACFFFYRKNGSLSLQGHDDRE